MFGKSLDVAPEDEVYLNQLEELGVKLKRSRRIIADSNLSELERLTKKLADRESKLSEEAQRFKKVFYQSGIGMAIIGLEGQWVEVNDVIPEMLGYSHEELHNLTWQDLTHPEDLQADLDLVERLLAGEIPCYQMLKRYISKSGEVVPAILNVSVIERVNGTKTPQYFVSQIIPINNIVNLASHFDERRGCGE